MHIIHFVVQVAKIGGILRLLAMLLRHSMLLRLPYGQLAMQSAPAGHYAGIDHGVFADSALQNHELGGHRFRAAIAVWVAELELPFLQEAFSADGAISNPRGGRSWGLLRYTGNDGLYRYQRMAF